MSAALQLNVKTRTRAGRRPLARLRQTGQLPAVLYGHGVASRSLAATAQEFLKVYRQAGESTLVDLVVDDGSPIKALIQEVQTDPITRQVVHVDFRQVNLREKITARIKLRFTGVASAVKEHGGVLMTNLSEVEVTCLPQDLVPEITVDLTPLKTFADYVHLRDLALPKGVTALGKPDDVVVHVIPPRTEEEIAALEQQPAAPVAAAVPVVGKEGEAPAAAGGGEREAAGATKA